MFAVQDLAEGETLIEYVGEIISWKEALRRHPHDPTDPNHTFYFHVDEKHVIDAKHGGNSSRWINHSCAPNCEADEQKGRVFIKALRNIPAGDELFYDYGLIIDAKYTKKLKAEYPCWCGSKNCRGTLLSPKDRADTPKIPGQKKAKSKAKDKAKSDAKPKSKVKAESKAVSKPKADAKLRAETKAKKKSAWVQSALERFERPLLQYALSILQDLDRAKDGKGEPTITDMTKAAITRLSQGDKGYVLMVEGGRIDHAAHGNDGAAAIREQVAFDEAIATVLAFIDQNPDTLLIITTDHGTGGFNVNGLGSEDFDTSAPSYAESSPAFDRMTGFTSSLELLGAKTKGLSAKDFLAAAEKATGLTFKGEDRAKIVSAKTLSAALMRYTSIGWTSNNHTGEMVEFCTYGPGSQLFTPHLRNDQVHAKILQATGVA